MKTLSIRSQYAYQVCIGIKDIENRSWKTDYRGKLLIHASGKEVAFELLHRCWPDKVLKDLKSRKFVIDHILQPGAPDHIKKIYNFYYDFLLPHYGCKSTEELAKKLPDLKEPFFTCQAIIGEVTLSDIVVNHKSVFAEKNQYNWILTNPVLYDKPIRNVKGHLRLWEYGG
jgi:hypothetical protein